MQLRLSLSQQKAVRNIDTSQKYGHTFIWIQTGSDLGWYLQALVMILMVFWFSEQPIFHGCWTLLYGDGKVE